jgi:hypothetical protein
MVSQKEYENLPRFCTGISLAAFRYQLTGIGLFRNQFGNCPVCNIRRTGFLRSEIPMEQIK